MAYSHSPIVSVVMAVHNGRRFLKEAVDSILGQTFGDFEFIIIDDGSTDGAGDDLRACAAADPRIRLLQRENKGLTASLNEGWNLARGRYMARMDGDDIAFPERLFRQVEFLEANPDIAALGTWVRFTNEEGNDSSDSRSATVPSALAWELAISNVIWHPTVMIRHEWLARVGGYDLSYPVAQDYGLWSKICRNGGRIAVLPEVLLRYRWSSNQISKNKADAQVQAVLRTMADHQAWLIGRSPDAGEVADVWNFLGFGKGALNHAPWAIVSLLLECLHQIQRSCPPSDRTNLKNYAFDRFLEKAKRLIPVAKSHAFTCLWAAFRANPTALLERARAKHLLRATCQALLKKRGP